MNFTDRQRKRLYEFISEILSLTEEENAAIDCQIPMTQELFEKCVDHCVMIDAQFTLNSLLNKYPEFSNEYVRKEEKKILDVELPEDMPERLETIWQKLCTKIKEHDSKDKI